MDTRRYSNNVNKVIKNITTGIYYIPALLFIPIMGIVVFVLEKLFRNVSKIPEDLDEQLPKNKK